MFISVENYVGAWNNRFASKTIISGDSVISCRPNIYLDFIAEPGMAFQDSFLGLVETLRLHGEKTPKTIIFAR